MLDAAFGLFRSIGIGNGEVLVLIPAVNDGDADFFIHLKIKACEAAVPQYKKHIACGIGRIGIYGLADLKSTGDSESFALLIVDKDIYAVDDLAVEVSDELVFIGQHGNAAIADNGGGAI